MKNARNLPEGLHHVLYEIEMATCAACRLVQDNPEPLMKSVWTEIFALHMRNLDEFFFSEQRNKKRKGKSSDDIRAEDFVDGLGESLASSEAGSTADRLGNATEGVPIFDRISEEIIHLTYKRKIRGAEKRWNVVGCFKPILEESLRFLDAIQDSTELLGFEDNRTRFDSIKKCLCEIEIKLQSEEPKKTLFASGETGPVVYSDKKILPRC